MTTFDDEAFILDAVLFGARGYLLKNNDPEKIRDAIITVHNGHNVFQDAAMEKLTQVGFQKHSKKPSHPPY